MSLEYLSDRDRPISNEETASILTRVSSSSLIRVLGREAHTLFFDDGCEGEELGRVDVEGSGVYLAFRGGAPTWNHAVRDVVQSVLNEHGGFSVLELD